MVSSFLQRFFPFHLSYSCNCWLVSTFLKGLSLFPCVLTCQVFRLLSHSPPLFFNLSKDIYILENFWTVLDSAPKLFSLGKSSGLFEVGGYVREELRSEGNWTPASLILNLRTRRGLSLTKTVSTWLVLYFRWTWTSVVSLGHYIFQSEFAVITCSST